MSQFKDIQETKDFLSLNAKRASALTKLSNLKVTFGKSKESPSLLSFQRNEAKLDSILEQLENTSAAVVQYFSALGGDTVGDGDFISYMSEESSLIGEVEVLLSSFHELLKSQNLFEPPAPIAPLQETVTQAGLLEALKVLAQSQTSAAETQAKALIKHFKSPILDVPSFDPIECKEDPLAWTSFKSKFDHFAQNCVDDESKLSFLFQAVKGDALKVIQGLTCTAENYEPALKLLR